jgi:hypothetical protein
MMTKKSPKEIAQIAHDNGNVTIFLAALCELIMCADPTPLSQDKDAAIKHKANVMAKELGFSDWVEAYHGLC